MSLSLNEKEAAAALAERKRARALAYEAELVGMGVKADTARFLSDRFSDAAERGEAFGHYSTAPQYDPDLEAYLPDPRNDPHAAFERAIKDEKNPAGMTLSILASGGRREVVQLEPAEAREFAAASLVERARIKARKVGEARLRCAVRATEKLERAVGGRYEPGLLTNDECNALDEFNAVREGRMRTVESRTGQVSYPVVRRVRPEFRKLAEAHLRSRTPERLREVMFADQVDFVPGAISARPQALPWAYAYDDENLRYGPAQQQMLLMDVWDELAKAQYAWTHDPVAKQGVNIIRGFALGRGVSIVANDQDSVQPVIDDFVKRHKFRRLLKRWATSLGRDGQLVVRSIVDESGRTTSKSLPANTIAAFVTAADDVGQLYYVVQRYPTRSQQYAPPVGPSQRFVHREIPANEITYCKVNCTDEEVYGRSDIYANLGWHKKFRDYWDAEVEKAQAAAAQQFDHTVEGTDAAVRHYMQTGLPTGRPRAGGQFVHNDKVKIAVVGSEAHDTSGQGSTFEGLLTVLAMGYGFAKEYFGVVGSRARGAVQASTEPSSKAFEERQDEIGDFLDELIGKVVDNAYRAGLIPSSAKDLGFRVQFPAIIKADSATRIKNLEFGIQNKMVSLRTASGVWASEMDMDDTYDFEDEQALIAEEEEMGLGPPALAQSMGGIDPTNTLVQKVQPNQVADGAGGAPTPGDGNQPGDVPNPQTAVGAAQIKKDSARREALARGQRRLEERRKRQRAVMAIQHGADLVVIQ